MKKNVNIDCATATNEPFVNLVSAIFQSAKTDWEYAHRTISQLGGEEAAFEQWNRDREFLASGSSKDMPVYKVTQKRVSKYAKADKLRKEVNAFLHSEWFEGLCAFCDLDAGAVIDEFEAVKQKAYL